MTRSVIVKNRLLLLLVVATLRWSWNNKQTAENILDVSGVWLFARERMNVMVETEVGELSKVGDIAENDTLSVFSFLCLEVVSRLKWTIAGEDKWEWRYSAEWCWGTVTAPPLYWRVKVKAVPRFLSDGEHHFPLKSWVRISSEWRNKIACVLVGFNFINCVEVGTNSESSITRSRIYVAEACLYCLEIVWVSSQRLVGGKNYRNKGSCWRCWLEDEWLLEEGNEGLFMWQHPCRVRNSSRNRGCCSFLHPNRLTKEDFWWRRIVRLCGRRHELLIVDYHDSFWL